MNDVVIRLVGGLGNQLFQYATARAVAARNNTELVLDLSWFSTVADRAYALAPFAINARILQEGPSMQTSKAQSLWNRMVHRLVRQSGLKKSGRPLFAERHFYFDPAVLDVRTPIYLDGYFQSERYFSDCADLIKEELRVVATPARQAQEMLEKIGSSEAVCLHVRRGDYVANAITQAFHGSCSLDYYRKGFGVATEGMRNPVVFVFSDEPLWVRENLKLEAPTVVVDIHGPNQAHEDLRLMAACRNFVIANSSFSWWAAWLGEHSSKKVVAPQRWFAAAKNDTRDLLPADWVRI
jgi:hypothetical protein